MQVDIWSLGVLLFVMIFYRFPFTGQNILMQIKKQLDKRLFDAQNILGSSQNERIRKKLTELQPEIKDLLQRTLVLDYQKRIDFVELHKHPAFALLKGSTISKEELEWGINFYRNDFANKEKKKELEFQEEQDPEYDENEDTPVQDSGVIFRIPKEPLVKVIISSISNYTNLNNLGNQTSTSSSQSHRVN